MKNVLRSFVPLAGSIALFLPSVRGADLARANNNASALNTTGAWAGAVVPTAADVMLWDNTFTVPVALAALPQLGGDMSVDGIKVTNVGGTLNAATTLIGFQNLSVNTLTIGASGINMSAATQALLLQSKITLGANQAWAVTNANTAASPGSFNNGEDLTFQGSSAAGTATVAPFAFNVGGRTVTTSGTGTIFITSGYTVSTGTFNIGNALFFFGGGNTRACIVSNDVNLNVASGSTLHFQSNSGIVTSNAAIALNGGTLKLVNNNAGNQVTINNSVAVNSASTLLVGNNVGGGSVASTNGILFNANLTGSGNLAVTNNASTASVLVASGNNSGYSGAITYSGTSGRILRLNTATAGSASATWNVGTGVILQTNGVSVDLGALNGAGTVNNLTGAGTINVGAGNFTGTIVNNAGTLALTKVGAGLLTLSGANTYTGATTINGGTLQVAPGVLSGTTVTVNNTGTLAAQAGTSGTLNTTVSVASGGTLLARPTVAGVQTTIPTVTTSAGSFVTLDTTTLGNPTAAPLIATNFNPTAGTTLRVFGSNLSVGVFPGIAYTTLGGGGFGGLSLALPFRVTGNLVPNPNSVDVNITAFSKPAWNGNVNGNWDIDNVGDGSVGTANWVASSGPNTYVEAPVGIDSVVFNDSATGTTTVNLTTNLSPGGTSVNNTSLPYTFTGSGKIGGLGALTKAGTNTLTIANTGTNDFSGGTTITDGTLLLGNGVTSGAGTLGTNAVTMTAPGALELNRPDDFTLANTLAGTGALIKSQANTATLSAASTFAGPVTLGAGTLAFSGGGNLSGTISGGGTLSVTGGTLQLSGTGANTMSGTTTVSAGTLQLNKTGVNALAGTLAVTGTGAVTFSQANQLADTATVTYDKAINGGSLTFNQADTVGAVTIINGNDTGAQVLSNTTAFGFQVAGLMTVGGTGVYSVASNSSAGVGGLSLSGTGTVRVSANSNPTTLDVGALGITASGGTIQVGQGTGAFDALLNLNGDVTTTGNLNITDGGFIGANLRQIQIGAATRTFNIGAGTTTTIAPDIAGAGGLTKTGTGTLTLTAASASSYTGTTTVSAGTLNTTPAQTGATAVNVGSATFGVNLATAGTTFSAATLDTIGGSTLALGTGTTGNPTASVLTLGTFTVGGATTLSLTGGALTTGTGIPLISYTSLAGLGFGGLTLAPISPRISGTLVDNSGASRVDVNINVEQVRWEGGINGNWDIDPDGSGGTGTANWRTTVSNTATRYFQGPPVATDTANFTDAATGTGTVNLTTSLTPAATLVNNNTKTYTFTGSGKLTGATSLTKSGPGALILAGTTAYDHTGGTTISGGTLQIGDGATAGAGLAPTGTITNNATLALNRPDDFTIANAIGGTGTIVKDNTNVATFSAAATNAHNYALNSGALAFGGGGTLSGVIAGVGQLRSTAGTLQLNGTSANTNSGLTTVSAGVLQLNKTGVNAVGGDIAITGTGQLSLLASEQVPDSATINFTGSSTDSILNAGAGETVANVIANSSAPGAGGGQVILRNGFTITGTATVNSGVFGVGSGQTATVNALNITAAPGNSALVRVAGNSAGSTLNVGAGGITASGGEIQVKFNTNAFDAVVNLAGNFTATGTVAVTNAGFTGTQLNVINLNAAAHDFNIATGTTTTVAPDLGGGGALNKTGGGTLTLTSLSNAAHTGATTVSAGTLFVHGALAGTSGTSVTGGTLGGNGAITGSVGVSSGAALLGGDGVAAADDLSIDGNLTLAAGSGIQLALGGALAHSSLTRVNGTWGFDPAQAFTFIDAGVVLGTYDNLIAGLAADPVVAGWTITNAGWTGIFSYDGAGGVDLNLVAVPEPGSAALLLASLGFLGLRRRRG